MSDVPNEVGDASNQPPNKIDAPSITRLKPALVSDPSSHRFSFRDIENGKVPSGVYVIPQLGYASPHQQLAFRVASPLESWSGGRPPLLLECAVTLLYRARTARRPGRQRKISVGQDRRNGRATASIHQNSGQPQHSGQKAGDRGLALLGLSG